MRKDGNEYPANTLYKIATAMQMYLQDNNVEINIFKDVRFDGFRRALNNKMKTLNRQGFSKTPRKAEIITPEMEKTLWQQQILGDNNPTKLLWTVYFILGTHFCLRARDEHRNLRAGANSQIKVLGMGKEKRVEYTEGHSKNNNGGLKHARVKPKNKMDFATRQEAAVNNLQNNVFNNCNITFNF